MKTCAACSESKALSDFGRDNRRPDGRNPYCRPCVNEKSRHRYENKPEVRKQKKIQAASWHTANREKSRTAAQKWREENRAYLKERKAEDYAANKDEIVTILRDHAFQRKFGITLETRDQLAAHQDGQCAICGAEESALTKRLAVDHDHGTGRVRGLLCQNCNLGLGHFRDDTGVLLAAINYLAQATTRGACADCQDCQVHNPRGASA